MQVLFITILFIFLISFVIYLSYAGLTTPQKWPFVKKKIVTQVKTSKGLSAVITTEPDQPMGVAGKVFGAIFAIVFLALLIVIVYSSVRLSLRRYEIAGTAIKEGNTGIAAAALAPEIGQGVGAGLSWIFKK